ncbi:MAG TPA: redoxin domain-containing protein [bacterium]|nr:redoxin domain-containing protein [bacterium]
MLTSWKFWTVMAVIIGLAGLFAFGFTRDPKIVQSPLVGRPAPGFAVTELDTGAPLSLEALHGTPFVLNFWASWCTACKAEAPLLERAYEQYERAGQPVRFIGIAIQDTREAAQAFARRYGKRYYLALDNERGDISLNWGLYGVPETFFVNAQGFITHKHIGPLTWSAIEEQMAPLLASRRPAPASPTRPAEAR